MFTFQFNNMSNDMHVKTYHLKDGIREYLNKQAHKENEIVKKYINEYILNPDQSEIHPVIVMHNGVMSLMPNGGR